MREKTRPLFHWYVDCTLGKELVLALYTRPCRYGRCAFCALPSLSLEGETVTARDIEAQIDWVLSQYSEEQRAAIRKVSVYTASSSLDQECLPTRSLMYLVLRISDLPNLELLGFETRPEYVEDWELAALSHVLGPRTRVEIGIGYETHDPILRNKVLGKGLTLERLHELLAMLARRSMSLKAYLMLKPHWSLTEEQGIVEACNGVDELADLSRQYGVPVSIHLNPTYIARGCRLAEELLAHDYEPPELTSLVEVLRDCHRQGIPVYVGLDDEGLAVQGGTFQSTGVDRERVVAAVQAFNRHQDFDRLLVEAGLQERGA